MSCWDIETEDPPLRPFWGWTPLDRCLCTRDVHPSEGHATLMANTERTTTHLSRQRFIRKENQSITVNLYLWPQDANSAGSKIREDPKINFAKRTYSVIFQRLGS